MMTRKHFQAIASAFAETRPIEENPSKRAQWLADMKAVARALSDQSGYDLNGNRRFDTDRFVDWAVTR